MRLVEVGTFALLVLFVAGMTVKHQEKLQAKEDNIESRKETIAIEEKLAELEKNTATFTVEHDKKLETNTVFVRLDATESFDAGDAAEFHQVTVPVYNEDKPNCIKWEDDCKDSRRKLVDTPVYDRLNNGLFEDKKCECEEYEEDECGDQVYEAECAKYREDCIDEEDCECITSAEKKIDYVDACEYLKLNHGDRLQYVEDKVPNHVKDELTYLWERVTGPAWSAINKDLFDNYKEGPVLKLELSPGDYRFRCTITDSYDYTSELTKDVKVNNEPNNDPEVYISDAELSGPSLVEFKATKHDLEVKAKEKEGK